MRRRQFGAIVLAAGTGLLRGLAATTQAIPESVKGKLVQHAGAPSVILTDDGQAVALSGDEDTEKVLHDSRLAGMTLEAIGHFTGRDQFAVEPIYEKNMFVLKNGKRLRITYWCDVCSIRSYVPGNCVCCQKWTALDLRDPNQE